MCVFAAFKCNRIKHERIPESDLTSVSMITPEGLLSVFSLGFQSIIMSFLCSHRAFLFEEDNDIN